MVFTETPSRVSIHLAEAVKLSAFDASLLGNRFEPTQEMSIVFTGAVRKHEIVLLPVE